MHLTQPGSQGGNGEKGGREAKIGGMGVKALALGDVHSCSIWTLPGWGCQKLVVVANIANFLNSWPDTVTCIRYLAFLAIEHIL